MVLNDSQCRAVYWSSFENIRLHTYIKISGFVKDVKKISFDEIKCFLLYKYIILLICVLLFLMFFVIS